MPRHISVIIIMSILLCIMLFISLSALLRKTVPVYGSIEYESSKPLPDPDVFFEGYFYNYERVTPEMVVEFYSVEYREDDREYLNSRIYDTYFTKCGEDYFEDRFFRVNMYFDCGPIVRPLILGQVERRIETKVQFIYFIEESIEKMTGGRRVVAFIECTNGSVQPCRMTINCVLGLTRLELLEDGAYYDQYIYIENRKAIYHYFKSGDFDTYHTKYLAAYFNQGPVESWPVKLKFDENDIGKGADETEEFPLTIYAYYADGTVKEYEWILNYRYLVKIREK